MSGQPESAIERGYRIRQREKIPVSEWATQHMRTERGEHLDFERYPHMVQVMDDRADEKGLMCGSQTGKTTAALADVYHFADTHQVTVIVTMHTQEEVRQFSQTRARPAIQSSPYLRERMGKIDSTEVKTFKHSDGAQSVIFFKGAQSQNAALSVPADMLYHDEIDRSRPDILSLYRARTAASVHGRRIITSTPTVPKYGIAQHWENSTQTQWLVKCPICGHEGPLQWPSSIAIDAEVPVYICAHGHELPRKIIRAGRWVDARTDGSPDWQMYHFSRMLMDLWPASRIVEIEQSEDYQDYPELFSNDVLGLPKSSGELAVNADVLAKVMVGYPPWHSSNEPTFGGCDQSPREGQHRVIIGGIDVEGAHSYVHLERCGWDRLADLMELFQVQFLVIDAMPETSKARELQQQFPGRVYLAWYANQPLKKTDRHSDVAIDRNEGKVNLDRTAALDRSARRVITQQDFFPAMDGKTRQMWMSEMTNMARAIEQDNTGQPRARWVNVGPDHYRHAHNYATVAGQLFRQWSKGPTMTSIDLGTGPDYEVEDSETGETLVVRPGYIPMPEGVIGRGRRVRWRTPG